MVGEVLGSYRIVEKLSVGGMGTVYRAEHELLGKPAAVKLLRPHLSRNEELISVDRLPTGEQAVVLELALPTRQISLATLAVAVPFGVAITLDSDILDSFVEPA